MPDHITGERLTSLFRPRSVALVGASDKSAFSQIAYHNLVRFGFAEHTYLVSRRGTPTHGQPTVTSCAQIGEPARRRGKWSEQDARALLAEAGIPVVPARLAGSADEAVKAAADLGGPLSVKIVSADILHKSDIGGVRLDVPADEDAVRAAYQAVNPLLVHGARIEALDVIVTWREHS
jgi:acyl-CoA synthetase (NDP forming)